MILWYNDSPYYMLGRHRKQRRAFKKALWKFGNYTSIDQLWGSWLNYRLVKINPVENVDKCRNEPEIAGTPIAGPITLPWGPPPDTPTSRAQDREAHTGPVKPRSGCSIPVGYLRGGCNPPPPMWTLFPSHTPLLAKSVFSNSVLVPDGFNPLAIIDKMNGSIHWHCANRMAMLNNVNTSDSRLIYKVSVKELLYHRQALSACLTWSNQPPLSFINDYVEKANP